MERQDVIDTIKAANVILAANVSKEATIDAFRQQFGATDIHGRAADRADFGWIAGRRGDTLVFVGQGTSTIDQATELLGSSTVPQRTIYNFRALGAIYEGYADARRYILDAVRRGFQKIELFGHSASGGFCNAISSILGFQGFTGKLKVRTIGSPKATDDTGVFYARNFDIINFSAIGDPICNIPPSEDLLDSGGYSSYFLQQLAAATVGDTESNRAGWRVFADPNNRVWLNADGIVRNPERSLVGDLLSLSNHYITSYITVLQKVAQNMPERIIIRPRPQRVEEDEKLDALLLPPEAVVEGGVGAGGVWGGAVVGGEILSPSQAWNYFGAPPQVATPSPAQQVQAARVFGQRASGVPDSLPDSDADSPGSLPRRYAAHVQKLGASRYQVVIGNSVVANFSRHRAAKVQCKKINQMVEHLACSQNFDISTMTAAIQAIMVTGSGRDAARLGFTPPLPGYETP